MSSAAAPRQQQPPASGAPSNVQRAGRSPCFVGSHDARRYGRAGLHRLGIGLDVDADPHVRRNLGNTGRPEPLHAQCLGHLECTAVGTDQPLDSPKFPAAATNPNRVAAIRAAAGPHPSAPLQSAPLQTTSYPYDMPIESGPSSTAPPQSSTPIHHIKFPLSPSPIPSWAYGTTTVAAPVYSLASPRPTITPSLPGSATEGAWRSRSQWYAVRRGRRAALLRGSQPAAPRLGRSDRVVALPCTHL
jgi:hypothetical protein